ncbi:hypothetical protein ACSVDA_23625 [Cytobacillus sp. Hm23]
MKIYLAAQSVDLTTDNNFVGLGTSGNLDQNNVVILEDATITDLIFSTRDNSISSQQSVMCEIVTSSLCGASPEGSNIVATVNGPSPRKSKLLRHCNG